MVLVFEDGETGADNRIGGKLRPELQTKLFTAEYTLGQFAQDWSLCVIQ